MHRTIDVIVHADGTIEPLEPVAGKKSRRAILTILGEAPIGTLAPADDDAAMDALLLAAGLQEVPEDSSDGSEPLSEEALDALWARIPAGTPLSKIVTKDREERF
jgi:hypothetical protein